MKIQYANRRPHYCVGRAILSSCLSRSFYIAAINFTYRTGLEARNIRSEV